MIYKGSCHCGAVAYEVEGDIQGVIMCNCSICHRKGAPLWFVPRTSLRFQKGEDALVDAVSRNVFPDGGDQACALALTLHLKRSVEAIRQASLADLRRGEAPFPAPSTASPTEVVQ